MTPSWTRDLAKEASFGRLDAIHVLEVENLFHRQNIFVDVLDAAIGNDSAEGLSHRSCSSADTVIAVDHYADISECFDPLGVEIRVRVRHDR